MAKSKKVKANKVQNNKDKMNIYIRLEEKSDGNFIPIFLIPLTDIFFLTWIKRGDEYPSEWMLKNIKYISSMREKFGPNTTILDICEKSKFLRVATPLDVLMYTGQSIEQVRDIFTSHRTRIVIESQK